MTSRQLRRAAERKARKEARQQEKIAAAAPAPAEETPRTRADEAAPLSEPKICADEDAPLSQPKTRQQINRANAQHSTGPKSSVGKANSSRNSFKHGLYSRQLVTSAEEAAELDALKADLRAEHQPINQTEEILVNEMAEQFWRIRRARRIEASLFDSGRIELSHLAAIQRMMSSAERGFHKALTTLLQLQKDEPVAQAPSPAAGFVPHPSRDCQGVELTADSCPLIASLASEAA